MDKGKCDDFDLYQLGDNLANSLSDALYREFSEEARILHKEKQSSDKDSDPTNDLDVEDIAKDIKEKLKITLADEVTRIVVKEVKTEMKDQYKASNSKEEMIDNALKFSRYIMIFPIAFAIIAFAFSYISLMFAEAYHMAQASWKAFEKIVFEGLPAGESINDVVTSMLSVMDILLIGSLFIMVIIGVYENTISRIGMSHDTPTWFGKLDIAELKIKVAASIIIISSIHLLVSFMQLDILSSINKTPIDYQSILWITIIHGVFVVSGIGLALMDKIFKQTADNETKN